MAISYSVQGAAEQTGLSASYIREAHRDGHLKGRFAGVKLIIEHEALKAWVESLPAERSTR